MAIVFNSDAGTISGLSVGGLPDGVVDEGTLATDSVTAAKIPDTVEAGFKSGRKNLIINGAMNVAQRGTSVTGFTNGSGNGYKTVDRYNIIETGAPSGVFTITQDTDAPVGFASSLKLDCTTAQASMAAADAFFIDYRMEGQNLQHLSYGTSSALQTTLSFWVKSKKTGTYVVWVYQPDDVRSVQSQYTVNTADTWEKKTCVIPADTTGVIDNTNAGGIWIRFALASGTDYTSGTASTAWVANATNANRYAGQTVNIADSTANYINITGVQFETGSVATDFEHRSYGEELALCQRYYYAHSDTAGQCVGGAGGFARTSNQVRTALSFPVTMRSSPSLSAGSGTNYYKFEHSTNTIYATTLGLTNTNNKATEIYASVSGATQGDARTFALDSSSAYVSFDSEL